jgi:hypothetical protein
MTLRTKLAVLLIVLGYIVSLGYSFFTGRRAVGQAHVDARTRAAERIDRSVEMFMVSTRKFHDAWRKSQGDPNQAKTVPGEQIKIPFEQEAASGEQARGIDQLNTAIAQRDKVTQQNAVNAEESDGAAEELNAQAESMNQIVRQLVALTDGASTRLATEKPERAKSVPSLSRSHRVLHRISALSQCFCGPAQISAEGSAWMSSRRSITRMSLGIWTVRYSPASRWM